MRRFFMIYFEIDKRVGVGKALNACLMATSFCNRWRFDEWLRIAFLQSFNSFAWIEIRSRSTLLLGCPYENLQLYRFDY